MKAKRIKKRYLFVEQVDMAIDDNKKKAESLIKDGLIKEGMCLAALRSDQSKERGQTVKKQVEMIRSEREWERDAFSIAMHTTKSGASNILGNLVALGFSSIGMSGPLATTYVPKSPCGCCKNDLPACLCFKED
jgi:hypothetical protein